MDFRHRVTTTTLQFALPMKLINMEVPKRDIHGPLEKGRGSRSTEHIGSPEKGAGARRMRRVQEEGCQGHGGADNMS